MRSFRRLIWERPEPDRQRGARVTRPTRGSDQAGAIDRHVAHLATLELVGRQHVGPGWHAALLSSLPDASVRSSRIVARQSRRLRRSLSPTSERGRWDFLATFWRLFAAHPQSTPVLIGAV